MDRTGCETEFQASLDTARRGSTLPRFLLSWALAWIAFASALGADRILDAPMRHLGDTRMRDWTDAPERPEGKRYDLRFRSASNAQEWTLSISQRDIGQAWHLELNGRHIADLTKGKEAAIRHYPLPPGVFVNGENLLSLVPEDPKDDIVVGAFHLYESPLREVLHLVPVQVRIRDESTLQPLPARITIASSKGKLAEVFYATNASLAVRKGIVYTGTGEASFEAPEGDYTLYVTRGTEWSRHRQPVSLRPAKPLQIDAGLRRELDTAGFIAADTHIHTVTYSKHGDASIDERMITIAAEGVELAVATDHNHNIDYAPLQSKAGLAGHFTPVTGNEVTTTMGHFNGFPLSPTDKPPDHKETNWVKLISDIRTRGAKVVILNHPRWPSTNRGPFGVLGLNRGSGERLSGSKFTFDAIELANSATSLQPDPLFLFQDWFSLLNHGERLWAVGSSDSHTVYDPVGQGRTYIRSSTDEPSRIHVDEACANFLAGDTSISLGLFATVVVEGRYKMGDLVPVRNRKVELTCRVQAPSWITPRRLIVFLNGTPAAEMNIPHTVGNRSDARLNFTLRAPPRDAHLVCVALGDGVDEPCWPTYEHYTLAATNPVFLDVDGDGRYSSPRETAHTLLGRFEGDMNRLRKLLAREDAAIGVQLLSLARADMIKHLQETAVPLSATNKDFELYLHHLREGPK